MKQKATNIVWHGGQVSRPDRERLLGQKGVSIWFTGFSGSGKSTAAVALETFLTGQGKLAYRLDGDNIRHGINANLGFSPEDRAENIRRIGEIAKLFVDAGIIVLSSFISPYRRDRELVRKLHEDAGMDFLEVFVDCPLAVAEARDPKGLYKKARAGEIREFTGIDAPYEPPLDPDLVLNTAKLTIDDELGALVELLAERGYLQG